MNNDIAPSASSRGFTLLELLAVITIISVLMGLIFPAIHAVQESMRRTRVKNTEHNIVAAVNAYFSEYGKLPFATPPDINGDVIVGEPAADAVMPNGALFDVLRDIDRGANSGHKLNPRQIIFYQDKAAANPAAPKDGFLDGPGANPATLGCLFDPWGHQFNVILDTNYDSYLQIDLQYTDYAGAPPSGQRPQAQVGAFSLGKDGLLGTNGSRILRESDDVASWQ